METRKEKAAKLLYYADCAVKKAENNKNAEKRELSCFYRIRNNAFAVALQEEIGCIEIIDGQITVRINDAKISVPEKPIQRLLGDDYDSLLAKNLYKKEKKPAASFDLGDGEASAASFDLGSGDTEESFDLGNGEASEPVKAESFDLGSGDEPAENFDLGDGDTEEPVNASAESFDLGDGEAEESFDLGSGEETAAEVKLTSSLQITHDRPEQATVHDEVNAKYIIKDVKDCDTEPRRLNNFLCDKFEIWTKKSDKKITVYTMPLNLAKAGERYRMAAFAECDGKMDVQVSDKNGLIQLSMNDVKMFINAFCEGNKFDSNVNVVGVSPALVKKVKTTINPDEPHSGLGHIIVKPDAMDSIHLMPVDLTGDDNVYCRAFGANVQVFGANERIYPILIDGMGNVRTESNEIGVTTTISDGKFTVQIGEKG